jgi:putrescine transport system permease protein
MRRFTWFNATSLTLGFVFLYLPMVILVIYSFNPLVWRIAGKPGLS